MLPVTWFLFCWYPPPIPRLALEHDLARCPCSLRSAKHHAFKLRKEGHQAHLKRALPLLSVPVQLRLVLGPRISVDWTQRLQLGVLDCSEQRRRKQPLWFGQRSRNGSGFVRLGCDICDRQSSRRSGMFCLYAQVRCTKLTMGRHSFGRSSTCWAGFW
jgi:hypothetical protein